jgi:tRNA A37 threonylcarbamoyladenosine synthetase subunit TsaC/SUA5/YrdC
LQHDLDAVVAAGHCGTEVTTVIDLTGGSPELIRVGKGALAPFGLSA